MKIILSIMVFALNYYSYTYGSFLWKNQNKKLAAFGVLLITALGVIVPVIEILLVV